LAKNEGKSLKFSSSFRRIMRFSVPSIIKIDAQYRGQAFGILPHVMISDLSHNSVATFSIRNYTKPWKVLCAL
jgi:hypothetical protein